jgi:phosphoglycerate dehydrogenase-like enzyme
MTRIAVLDDWQRIARASADWTKLQARADVVFFEEPFADEDDAANRLADFDVLLAMRERTPFPASLVRRLGKLKLFGLTGHRAGLIDMKALAAQGVTICTTSGGQDGAGTAEIALGLMLAAARHIPRADASTRAGSFQRGVPLGFELAGKTLGLLGLGRLGQRMARCGHALGMTVVAWSQNLTAEAAQAGGAEWLPKDELLARADVLSLHLVLSGRTRGIVGAAELARMKQGAILVNTSRAPLVDEAALVAALRADRIVAALDVYDGEPLRADHPFCSLPNTVLTPHLGYSTAEVYRVFFEQGIENALAFLDGAPIRVLDVGGEG